MDDGRPQGQIRTTQRRPLGPVPREAITIKVTPLKPLLGQPCPRGTSEWFYRQTEVANFSSLKSPKPAHLNNFNKNMSRYDSLSRLQCSSISTATSRSNRYGKPQERFRRDSGNFTKYDANAINKFSFTQSRDRFRGGKDILKVNSGSVFEKSLRVTELLTDQSLPNCVTRQAVMQRTVFNQSPLEAGIESVCSWCAVLFRTAVATNGLAVIGKFTTPSNSTVYRMCITFIDAFLHYFL